MAQREEVLAVRVALRFKAATQIVGPPRQLLEPDNEFGIVNLASPVIRALRSCSPIQWFGLILA